MEYVSPGDAFSSSLEHSLLLRQQQARQQQQDQLDQQREARMSRIQEEERQQAREALAEKRQEFADSQKDKQKASFEKSLSTMLPGDIPSPDMVEQSKKFGLGHLFPVADDAVVKALPVPESIAAPGDNGAPQGPMPQPTPQVHLPVKFLGSPKQRQDDADKQEALQFTATLPDGPEKKAMEYYIKTGKTPPAGMFKAPHVANPGTFEDFVVRTYGEEPTPQQISQARQKWATDGRDPNAGVAAGASRDAEALRKAYDGAITEFNTRAKPIEGHISAINDLGMVLNERTPQADALIAPMVLKATVSGTGTGFRMTQSEINQVIGARSKWESLEAALNKWSANPKEALSITDEQRTELRQLAKAIRAKAQSHMDNIIKTRHELDDATDPKVIKQLRTRLQNDLSKGESDGDSKSIAAPKSAADYLKEFNARAAGAKQ